MVGTGYTAGDFTADQIEEHVLIPGRVGPKGQITLADGSPLPALREGASVQLRVRAMHVTDKAQRAALSSVEVRELLPADTEVFAIVDARALDDQGSRAQLQDAGLLPIVVKARQLLDAMKESSPDPFAWRTKELPKAHEGIIPVRLLEPLMMERKGSKPFRLQPCACRVPDLPHPAGEPDHDYSLNHALTRISELLEVRRISHTGNVFSRYLVSPPGSRDGRLVRLGVLRDGY